MGRQAEHTLVEVWGRAVRLAYAVRTWKQCARQIGKPWPEVRRALLRRGTGPLPLLLDGVDVTLEVPVTWGLTRIGGGRLWFECPQCRRRLGVLYGCRVNSADAAWSLRCMTCLDLRYASTQIRGTTIAGLARQRRFEERGASLDRRFQRSRSGSKRREQLEAVYRRFLAAYETGTKAEAAAAAREVARTRQRFERAGIPTDDFDRIEAELRALGGQPAEPEANGSG